MRIAFCKFAGLANGGTEKYLQTIAIEYKARGADVDYYYTNPAPFTGTSWRHPDNDDNRKSLVESYGINTIKINVNLRDNSNWVGTNFFDKFIESDYDLLVTAGDGRPEFPYWALHRIPIIHTVHGTHVHNKQNITSILLCDWQSSSWLKNGGDRNKLKVIPPIIKIPDSWPKHFREQLNIPDDAFVCGLHQAAGVGVVDSLAAFYLSQSPNDWFVILGGSDVHRQFCSEHKIRNVIFIPATSDQNIIHGFLDCIDVYAHCRGDGEVCSASIIEAMAHGKPVVSIYGSGPNFGHVSQLDGCGLVADSVDDYANKLRMLHSLSCRGEFADKIRERYNTVYKHSVVSDKLWQVARSLTCSV